MKKLQTKKEEFFKGLSKEEWIKKLKPYWKEYEKIESEFFKKVNLLEERMRKEENVEDLELAYNKYGGGIELYFGIGFNNLKEHDTGLLHGSDLDD